MNTDELQTVGPIMEYLRANGSSVLRCDGQWSTATTAIVHQKPIAAKGSKLADHFLELCLDGTSVLNSEFDGLIGDRRVERRPNTVSYLPRARDVSVELESGSSELLQLYVDNRVFRDVATELYGGDPDAIDLFGFSARFDPRLTGLMRSIHTEMEANLDGCAMMVDHSIQQIAVLMIRQSMDIQRREAIRRPQWGLGVDEYSRAIEMIEAHLDRNLGLAQIADELGITVQHLCRAFKVTAGVAPHQFLLQRRVDTVLRRLAETNDSLAAIATDTGFSSQAHMTTIFKKFTGTTPGAYRREIRC